MKRQILTIMLFLLTASLYGAQQAPTAPSEQNSELETIKQILPVTDIQRLMFEYLGKYRKKQQLCAHIGDHNVNSLSASADGRYIVEGYENEVIIWELKDAPNKSEYEVKQTIKLPSPSEERVYLEIQSTAISSNHLYLAIVTYRKVFIYQLKDNKYSSVKTFDIPSAILFYNAAARGYDFKQSFFFDRSNRLVVLSVNAINIYQLAQNQWTHAQRLQVDAHAPHFMSMASTQDGNYLIAGTDKGGISLWRFIDNKYILLLDNFLLYENNATIGNVAITSDGKYIISSTHSDTINKRDNAIKINELKGNSLTTVQEIPLNNISCMILSPDNKYLAVATAHAVHIFMLKDNKFVLEEIVEINHSYLPDWILIAFLPDPSKFVAGSSCDDMAVWEKIVV
jgi:WD40 repeat protein